MNIKATPIKTEELKNRGDLVVRCVNVTIRCSNITIRC